MDIRSAWSAALPTVVAKLARRWSIAVGPPFADAGSCSWVAPATRADGGPAVLKVGLPHMEGEHEIAGLRFWAGDGVVRLLEADEALGAMLLERCEPGTSLRTLPESEQDVVVAGLLRRLWREPPEATLIRDLAEMTAFWSGHTLAAEEQWRDAGRVRAGLALFEELPRNAPGRVTLATDLHAGNVLRAQRESWLAIDPKPFVGDPAYDATQHLLNCVDRLRTDPLGTLHRFADLLEVDRERVRLWLFARLAAEPRDDWDDEASALARRVAW